MCGVSKFVCKSKKEYKYVTQPTYVTFFKFEYLQLDAMVEEWKPVAFEVLAFKLTKTFVIRKTDPIATLLDEQIIKTQTMRGSPCMFLIMKYGLYVKN